MTQIDNVQAVIDTAKKAAEPVVLFKNDRFADVYVPSARGDGEIKRLDLEATLATPLRKRGKIQVFDAASLNMMTQATFPSTSIATRSSRPSSPC